MKEQDGQEYRALLREVIAERVAQEPVALLFSGGTDSLTILWTLLGLGARVTCYTFRLPEVESTDIRASRLACQHWGVPQEIVVSGSEVAADVRETITIIKSDRKTHVEVMYAYRFLMGAVKERQVWTGIQADTLYGSNKNAAIRCGKASAEEFAQYRRGLLASPGQEGLQQAQMMARHFGKELCVPYADPRLRDWFMRWPWRELNTPKQKMPPVLGFADRFQEVAIYRHDDNLQCGSGIREHMAAVFHGHQRAAYKRMLQEVSG